MTYCLSGPQSGSDVIWLNSRICYFLSVYLSLSGSLSGAGELTVLLSGNWSASSGPQSGNRASQTSDDP